MPIKRPRMIDTPQFRFVMKWMSRAHTWLYRKSDGTVAGKFLKSAPVALVTTIGRRSGEPRTVPLIYLREGDRVVLVAAQAGRATHPLWYLNLQADPYVTVQIKGEVLNLTARDATDAERAQYWPRLALVYSGWDVYQSWTERVIPVVICDP